jgi:hypothetical protein
MCPKYTAVDRWLNYLRLQQWSNLLVCLGDVGDFLVLPFLQKKNLQKLGLTDANDLHTLSQAISNLQSLSSVERKLVCSTW